MGGFKTNQSLIVVFWKVAMVVFYRQVNRQAGSLSHEGGFNLSWQRMCIRKERKT